MKNLTKKSILRLKQSSTLVINEKCKELIKQGKKVYQFGFGQSPFPVPEKIVTALKDNAHRKEYLPIQGLKKLRESISKNLKKKIGINYPTENIVITPGSKEAMLLLHVAFNGEIILLSTKEKNIIFITFIFQFFIFIIIQVFEINSLNHSLKRKPK